MSADLEANGGESSEIEIPISGPMRNCPICGSQLAPESAALHVMAERWVIEQIREDHPEWVESDGACPKCLEFYSKL